MSLRRVISLAAWLGISMTLFVGVPHEYLTPERRVWMAQHDSMHLIIGAALIIFMYLWAMCTYALAFLQRLHDA
jgi:hypothetical protein